MRDWTKSEYSSVQDHLTGPKGETGHEVAKYDVGRSKMHWVRHPRSPWTSESPTRTDMFRGIMN